MTDPGGMPPRDPLRPDDPNVTPPAPAMPPPDLGAMPPPQPIPPPPVQASGAGAPADLGTRFVARIIDGIILGVINGIIGAIILGLGGAGGFANPYAIGFGGFSGRLFLYTLIGAAISIAYFALMESSRGQTVGKMAMSLRTEGPGGGNPTMEQAVKRNAWYAVNIDPGRRMAPVAPGRDLYRSNHQQFTGTRGMARHICGGDPGRKDQVARREL